MNPEVKQKWVEALRGGQYEQTKGVLRKGDAFCCLGVLCDVMGAEWELADDETNTYHALWGTGYGDGVLPVDLTDELGLKYRNPEVLDEDGATDTLASMNDRGQSFNEIADKIESGL